MATDIAARGIDISFLPYVINFEPPDDTELYIHRTGRTGRVDRKGRAVTLVAGRDIHNIRKQAMVMKDGAVIDVRRLPLKPVFYRPVPKPPA